MELRELKYFLAVAQEGSISAAAEYLYMTQPSLSRQMQNLEKEVGGPLFERGSRRINLTERGLLLKKRAEEMLELYEKTVAEVSAPVAEVSGEVFIGGGESPALKSVIRAAMNVKNSHEKVKFHFFSGDASSVLEKLDKGLIDFGILLDMHDLSQYNSLRLSHRDRWGVLIKNDDPLAQKSSISPDDLRGKTLITSDQALAKGMLVNWLGTPANEINVVATYNLLYVGSQLTREGFGYALGLDGIINTEGTDITFVPLDPPVYNHADVIWKKFAVFSKPAQLFLKELKSVCDQEN